MGARTLQEKLIQHKAQWGGCTNCPLHETRRKIVLFDIGVSTLFNATRVDVLMIGEAPGECEDIEGRPFVGRSGKLLRRALEGVQGDKVWAITNTISCRPVDDTRKNRMPSELEIKRCSNRLLDFIQLVEPRVIITLGRVSQLNLPFEPTTVPLFNTAHPSHICRTGGDRSPYYRSFIQTLQEAFTYESQTKKEN